MLCQLSDWSFCVNWLIDDVVSNDSIHHVVSVDSIDHVVSVDSIDDVVLIVWLIT